MMIGESHDRRLDEVDGCCRTSPTEDEDEERTANKTEHPMLMSSVQRRRTGSDEMGVRRENGRIVGRLSIIGLGNLN